MKIKLTVIEGTWAGGIQLPNRPSARLAYDRLEKLRKENKGDLSPKLVVKDARKAGSLFHGMFLWDDAVAALKHREQQARQIIGGIRVRYEESPPNSDPTRLYIHVSKGLEDSRYVTTARSLSTPEMRDRLLKNAWNEAKAWRKRYSEFKELADIFRAIDRHKAA